MKFHSFADTGLESVVTLKFHFNLDLTVCDFGSLLHSYDTYMYVVKS